MNYDTLLFRDILDSIQGINFVREDSMNGVTVLFYDGHRGTVCIDATDDFMTDDTAKGYLTQLGLEHLIPSLFPPIPAGEKAELKEIIKLENPEKLSD